METSTITDLPRRIVSARRIKEDLHPREIGSFAFSGNDLQNTPGTAGDISRYLGTLPSVVSGLGEKYDNTLYVRGGRPSEIIFLVDGIELENINHFSQANGSGGPIGFLNSDFVGSVRFYSANMPAEYPARLSSVADITMKSGSMERFAGSAGAKLTGGTISADGPVPGLHGSYAVAGRYIDFSPLHSFIGDAGIPRLGDLYVKVLSIADEHLDISATGVLSHNRYRYAYPIFEAGDTGGLFTNTINEMQRIIQGGGGLSLHYEKGAYTNSSNVSVSFRNGAIYDSLSSFSDAFALQHYAKNPMHEDRDDRMHIAATSRSVISLPGNQTVSVGARLNKNADDFGLSDETRRQGECIVCENGAPVTVTISQTPREQSLHLDGNEAGAFAAHTLDAGAVHTSIGVRADYFGLIADAALSPRFAAMVSMGNAGALTGSAGLFHQFPTDLPSLVFGYLSTFSAMPGDSLQLIAERLLTSAKPARCMQASMGYESNLLGILQTRIEAYGKWYDREFPFVGPDAQEIFHIAADGSPALGRQNARRRAYGIEWSLNNPDRDRYSYSLAGSFFDVKNLSRDGTWHNDWTNVGYTYAATIGAICRKHHMLAFSIQGSGGRPYCPQAIASDCIARKYAVLDPSRPYYSQRLDALVSTNLQYRFARSIGRAKIESSIEIINLLNYKPVLEYKFNGDHFQEVKPFGFTPIVGCRVEI
jgi:hypothetical protein